MFETISTPVTKLKPNPHNARTHSKKQLRQIADSIKQFGFVNPIIADEAAS
jgi:ParB-like chromosome segregation protein Spo0J